MLVRIIIASLLNLFLINSTEAQTIVTTKLRNQQQLPLSQLFRIFQDSEGYIWYATQGGGLCRDDGYSVKIFRSDYITPDLLESNWITCITEDNKNRIWFGTKRGLYILDKKTYHIVEIADKTIKNWSIDALKAASDGTIWVSTANLIIHYNSNEQKLDTYHIKWKKQSRSVSQIYEDKSKKIWIIQWKGGIWSFDAQKNNFTSYHWPFQESPTAILQDSKSKQYWVATWGKGIVKFSPEATNLDKRYIFQNKTFNSNDFSRNYILGMTQDSNYHQLWTITKDNLYSYINSAKNELIPVAIKNNLPSDKMFLNQIISDKKGNLWVAADYPQSFTLSFNQKQINRINIPEIKNELGFPLSPNTFVYDKGYYWFWQKQKGLYLYNNQTQKLTYLSDAPGLHWEKKSILIEKAKHTNGVYTVLNDTKVVLLNHVDGKLKLPETIVQIHDNQRIHSLYEDQFSNLWIGTNNKLYKYDLTSKKITTICNNIGVVNNIIVTHDKKIFLATEKLGLCKVDEKGEIKSFGANKIFSSIAIGTNNTIWSGTEQGDVYYFDSKNNQIVSVKEKANLNGDAILSVATDNSGYVWILTNQRIIIYNPVSQSSNVLFNSDPAIAMNNFLFLRKDEKGTIQVGGIGGFCTFPSYAGFKNKPEEIPVKLTSVVIGGEMRFSDFEKNKVILQPNEINVELFFSTLDHLNADKIRFAFRYKNKNEKWEYLAEGHNNVFLTGLSKGLHTLEIKATDANGLWANKVTEITINRLPAWYETIWAIIVYIIITILVILISIHYYLKWNERKLIDEQIRNSAIDLQDLVNQLYGDNNNSQTSEDLNLKALLLDMKKLLQQQREQKTKLNSGLETENTAPLLSSFDEKFIQKALSLVEENIDSANYSVEQLSQDLGMDRTGLYRKLVNIIGKTPTDFIRSTRLKRAIKHFEEGYTVAETADRVGFGTASYLSKCFRDEFGIKPSEYIAKLKKKDKEQ